MSQLDRAIPEASLLGFILMLLFPVAASLLAARRPGYWNFMNEDHSRLASSGKLDGVHSSANGTPLVIMPKTAGLFTLQEGPRIIDAKGIFEYMDGAGELYLAYRFEHLEVHNYASADQNEILVELYWMKSSEDAFGLLSGDWGGEPIILDEATSKSNSPAAPQVRALYGAGLLRVWSGNLYARIMATQETEPARMAIIEIGRKIVVGRDTAAAPRFTSILPASVGQLAIRRDQLCYLRSHLVLNSVYFLSPENILDLNLSAEAVTAPYRNGTNQDPSRSPRLLVIAYPDASSCRQAQKHFLRTYLPEKRAKPGESADAPRGVVQIEDGWLGYGLAGRFLAVVFECQNRGTALDLVDQAIKNVESLEVSHE